VVTVDGGATVTEDIAVAANRSPCCARFYPKEESFDVSTARQDGGVD
jgi:hypothetical protein